MRVENPDELLATDGFGAGALIRIESSATGGGLGFSELDTVALVAATTIYTYYDTPGTTSTFYRTRYSNAGDTNRSEYGAEFQATTWNTEYCSLYDVKQKLGITDATDDEELLQIIGHAAGFIESKTHRPLYPDPVTVYTFDGHAAVEDGRCLRVPRGVVSLSGLKYATQTGGTLVALSASDWVLRPTAMNRQPGYPATEIWVTDTAPIPYFYPGYDTVEATGVFGWPAVPREIEAIALRLVIGAWRGRSSGGGDTFTIGTEGERTFERMLSFQDRLTLESYDAAVLVG